MGRFFGYRTVLPAGDGFDRADGAVGSPWDNHPDGGVQPGFTISGGVAFGLAGNPWMFYDLPFSGAAVEVGVDIPVYSSADVEVELLVGAGDAAWGGYAMLWNGSNWLLRRYGRSSADSNLATASTAPVAGDSIRLRKVGATLQGFHNGVKKVEAVDPDPFEGPFTAGLFAAAAATGFDNFVLGPAVGGLGFPTISDRRR